MRPKRVLVVVNDAALLTEMRRALRNRGFLSAGVYSLTEGLAVIDDNSFDAVVCELSLRDGTAMVLLRELAMRSPSTARIALVEPNEVPEGQEEIVHTSFVKPADPELVLACIEPLAAKLKGLHGDVTVPRAPAPAVTRRRAGDVEAAMMSSPLRSGDLRRPRIGTTLRSPMPARIAAPENARVLLDQILKRATK